VPAAVTRVWSGADLIANPGSGWSDPANWVGNTAPNPGEDLLFPGGVTGAILASVNDFSDGTQFNSITIDGSGYNLTGAGIVLGPGGLAVNSAAGAGATQDTIGLNLTLASASSITNTFAGVALDIATGITIDTGANNVLTLGGSGTIIDDGTITDGGSVIANGPGLFQVDAANTYAGTTTINAGVVQLHNAAATLGAGAVTVKSTLVNGVGAGATLQLLGGANLTEALTLTGTGVGGGFVTSTGGALEASGSATVSGTVTLAGNATIGVDPGATLTVSGPSVTLAGGTLTVNAGAGASAVFNTAVGGVATTGNLVVNSALTGGTVALNNGGGYTGSTTVNGGTLALSGATSLLASGNYLVTQNATLLLDDTGLAGSVNHVPTTAGLTLYGGTLTFAGSAAANVTETVGAITLSGGHSTIQTIAPSVTQSVVLSATSVARSKGATVNFTSTGNALGTTNDQIVFTGGSPITPAPLGVNGGSIIPWATVGDSDFATTAGGKGVTAFSAYVLNPANLATVPTNSVVRITTPGTTILSTGNATMAALSLAPGVTLQINLGLTVNITGGGLLLADATIAPSIGSGVSTLNFGTSEGYIFTNAAVGTSNLGLNIGGGVPLQGLLINGTGGVDLSGPTGGTSPGLSVVPISSGSTYTGGTYLNSTNITVQGAAPLSASTNVVTLVGGSLTSSVLNYVLTNTMSLAGAQTTLNASNLTLSGAVVVSGVNALNVVQPTTFTGAMAGGGSLVELGNSVLDIDPAARNSYSGGTVLVSGTLVLGSNNSPLGTGPVILTGNAATGSTLQTTGVAGTALGNPLILNSAAPAAGANVTLTGTSLLTFVGGVVLNGETTLAVNVPTSISGVVSGPGALTQAGTSTLTFSGINTYTGATMLTSGGVAVNGSQAGSPVGVIGGTLSGTGTAGPITVGPAGTVEPGTPSAGNNAGTLSAPTANFSEGGNLTIQISTNIFTTLVQYSSLNLGNGNVIFGGTAPLFSTLTLDLTGLTNASEALGVLVDGNRLGIVPAAGQLPRFQQLRIIGNPNDFAAYQAYSPTGLNIVLTPGLNTAAIVPAGTDIWTGLGNGDPDWTNPENWFKGVAPSIGDSLIFPAGAAELSTRNDFPVIDPTTGNPWAFRSITLDSGGYTLAGNSFELIDFMVTDEPAAPAGQPNPTNTVTIPLALPTFPWTNGLPFPITVTFTVQFAGTNLVITSPSGSDSLQMNGDNLDFRGDGDVTITQAIVDAGGGGNFVKNSTGHLYLSPNPNGPGNSWPGFTKLNAGITVVNAPSSLGNSFEVQVIPGATIQTVGNIAITQPLFLGGYGVAGPNGQPLGALDDTGTLTLAGGLDVLGPVFGQINIDSPNGVLNVAALGSTGGLDTGGLTLVLNNNGTVNISVPVIGAGGVVIEGSLSNTVNLTAANTFAGDLVVNAGTTTLSGGGILAGALDVVVGTNTDYAGLNKYPVVDGGGAYGTVVLDDTPYTIAGTVPTRLASVPNLVLDGGAFIFKGPAALNATETVGVIECNAGQSFISMQVGTKPKASLLLKASSFLQNTLGASVDISYSPKLAPMDAVGIDEIRLKNAPTVDAGGIIPFATVSLLPPLGHQPVASFATFDGATNDIASTPKFSNNSFLGAGLGSVIQITAPTTVPGSVTIDALVIRTGGTLTIPAGVTLTVNSFLLTTPDSTKYLLSGPGPAILGAGTLAFGANAIFNSFSSPSVPGTTSPTVVSCKLGGGGNVYLGGTSTIDLAPTAATGNTITGIVTLESGLVIDDAITKPFGTGTINFYGGVLAFDTAITGSSVTLSNPFSFVEGNADVVGYPLDATGASAPLDLTLTGAGTFGDAASNGYDIRCELAIPANVAVTMTGLLADVAGVPGGIALVPGGAASGGGTLVLNNPNNSFSQGVSIGSPIDEFSGTPGSPAMTLALDSDGALGANTAIFTPFGGTVEADFSSTAIAIADISETGTTVTVDTATPIPFATGDSVEILGVTPSGYDGVFIITKTGSNTFTYTAAPKLGPATFTTATVTNVLNISNTVWLDGGVLNLGGPPGSDANISFSGGTMELSGVTTLVANVVLVNYDNVVDLPPKNGTIGSLSIKGSVTFNSSPNPAGNTQTGATDNSPGPIVMNASQPNSPMDITDDILQGLTPANGSLDYLSVGQGGLIAPSTPTTVGTLISDTRHQAGQGILSGGANFSNSGSLELDINSPTGGPGVGWDQLNLGANPNSSLADGLLVLGGTSRLILNFAGFDITGAASTVTIPQLILYGNRSGNVPVWGEVDIINNPNNYAVELDYVPTQGVPGENELDLVVGFASTDLPALAITTPPLSATTVEDYPITLPSSLGVSGVSEGGTTVTVTTATAITFPTGQPVTITGIAPSGYDGTFTATVTGANTFTYTAAAGLGPATLSAAAAVIAGGYTASDPTAVNPLNVTLSVPSGTLSVVPSGTMTGLTGNGTSSVSFSDQQGNITGDLAGLVFTPLADFVGTVNLTVTATNVGGATLLGTIPQTTTFVEPINVLPGINNPLFQVNPGFQNLSVAFNTGFQSKPNYAIQVFGQPPVLPTNNLGNLQFTVTDDFPALFQVQPKITIVPAGGSNPATGTLTFTPNTVGTAGIAHLSITLSTTTKDSAGQLHSFSLSVPLPTITITTGTPLAVTGEVVHWGTQSGSLPALLAQPSTSPTRTTNTRQDLSFSGINAIDLVFNNVLPVGQSPVLTIAGVAGQIYSLSTPILVGNNTYEWKLLNGASLASLKGFDNITIGVKVQGTTINMPTTNFNVLVGDVNGDGRVDSYDLLSVTQNLTTRYSNSNLLAVLMDVDGDTAISMADYFLARSRSGNLVPSNYRRP
jgi:autotransporter-associated beta strand protein